MRLIKHHDGVPYAFHVTRRRHQQRIVMRPSRPGEFRLTVPKRTSRRLIEAVIEENIDRLLAMPMPTYPAEFEAGDTISLFGKPLTVLVGKGASPVSGVKQVVVPPDIDTSRYIRRVLTDALNEAVTQLVKRHEGCVRRRSLGSLRFTVRPMKSKFGSCRPDTGRVTLNLELAHYPEPFLEMIFLHEIAHLDYPNHQEGFYGLMDKLSPNHRSLRKQLNRLRHALLYEGFAGLLTALKDGERHD